MNFLLSQQRHADLCNYCPHLQGTFDFIDFSLGNDSCNLFDQLKSLHFRPNCPEWLALGRQDTAAVADQQKERINHICIFVLQHNHVQMCGHVVGLCLPDDIE